MTERPNFVKGVAVTGSIPAGTNNIGDVDVLTIGGQTPAMVNTNQLVTTLKNSSGVEPNIAVFNADAMAAQNSFAVQAIVRGWNEASFDRWRNNTEGTLLASAARTSTTATSDQTNHNAKGVLLLLNITANPGGAETLTVALQEKDPVSGAYLTLTAFPATVAAANNNYGYLVYPGAVETAGASRFEVQGVPVPRTFRVVVTHSAGGSWTYSLGYHFIL